MFTHTYPYNYWQLQCIQLYILIVLIPGHFNYSGYKSSPVQICLCKFSQCLTGIFWVQETLLHPAGLFVLGLYINVKMMKTWWPPTMKTMGTCGSVKMLYCVHNDVPFAGVQSKLTLLCLRSCLWVFYLFIFLFLFQMLRMKKWC